jgi:HEAT repeat protein
MDTLAISHIFSEDPDTIGSLGDIASDLNAALAVRQSAAEVLRNVHTPYATSILAPLIDDPDPSIREDAIAAIACLANGVPPMDMHNGKIGIDLSRDVPTKTTATLNHFAFGHETISSQEAYYRTYWRLWWQINSPALLRASTN